MVARCSALYGSPNNGSKIGADSCQVVLVSFGNNWESETLSLDEEGGNEKLCVNVTILRGFQLTVEMSFGGTEV